MGNSHPECAINDTKTQNMFNLSQGGSAYFYDYLKLREIKKTNPQIDTLILGYGYRDLHNDMDSWFSGEEKFKYKIRSHFILFRFEDYVALFKSNPVKVLINTPQTIYYNIITALTGYHNLGGYIHSRRDKLKEDKAIVKRLNRLNSKKGYSKHQITYLLKIYQYCVNNNIQLVLLNTPIHPLERKHLKNLIPEYYRFAEENLPKAHLIDHANFELPESHYGDLEHLNYLGANKYTAYLKSSY
ncbi:hypothetical protein [uncultured Zobellia sp.]|uniref:hypothetical protein n=1 Tax=uncultured Zobellia sp. TaxID=255433 RepID=UPI002592789C|nr:hypothetical protein [uncultured Zobellia sp.]